MHLFSRQYLALALRRLLDQGYLHVFSANVLLQILGFGSVLLVAKFLSPTELAAIKTAQAYAAVLVILAGLGLTTPILLYCADHAHDDAAKQAMLITALKKMVIAGIALVVIIQILVRLLLESQPFPAKVYSLYALSLPALALTGLLYAYLQARQEFAKLAKSQAAIKLGSIGLVILATYLWGIYGFLSMTVLTAYAGLIPLVRLALPNGLVDSRRTPRDFYSRAAFGMTGMFVTMLGQSSDFMLMDFIHINRDEVGRYALASVFLLATMTLTGSIQTVVTPKFTAMRDTPGDFLSYLSGWKRKMPLISISVSVATVIFAWLLEHWFFGAQYGGFTLYLAILMLKYVVWSNYAIVGAAMLGAGVIKSGVGVAVLTTLVSFAFGLPLGQWFGVMGVAWTQVLVSVVTLCAVTWVQRMEFGRMFGTKSNRLKF